MKRITIVPILFFLLPWTAMAQAVDGDQARNQKIEQMFSEYRKEFPDVPVVNVRELIFFNHDPKNLLVDVRTPAEQEVSMIPGAMTRQEFEKKEKNYKGLKIIAYCTIGYRSGLYAAKLRAKGFDAYNLEGGVLAWANAHQGFLDKKGKKTMKVHVYGWKWNLLPGGYEAVW